MPYWIRILLLAVVGGAYLYSMVKMTVNMVDALRSGDRQRIKAQSLVFGICLLLLALLLPGYLSYIGLV